MLAGAGLSRMLIRGHGRDLEYRSIPVGCETTSFSGVLAPIGTAGVQGLEALSQFFSGLTLRQRRLLLVTGLGLAALVAIAFGLASSTRQGAPGASVLRSPTSVFASRSLGARGEGALFQSKPRVAGPLRSRSRPAGVVPRERVLSPVRTRPGGPLQTAPDAPLLGLQGLTLPIVPPSGVLPEPAFRSPYIPDAGFGYPPSFAGGPIVDRLPDGGGTPRPPPPPIPEPATWALLIMGLGFVGIALRRQSRKPAGDRSA